MTTGQRERTNAYGENRIQRVARLGPLHWLTLSIFTAIGVTVHFRHVQVNHAELYDGQCFLPNLFFLNSVGVCPYRSFKVFDQRCNGPDEQ